jgi:hypothetical protein
LRVGRSQAVQTADFSPGPQAIAKLPLGAARRLSLLAALQTAKMTMLQAELKAIVNSTRLILSSTRSLDRGELIELRSRQGITRD